MDNGAIKFYDETKCVSKEEYELLKKNLNQSTILMSINGTIGNLAFFNNEKVVLGKSAAYINLNDKVDKRFVYFLLQHSSIKSFYENELTGTTIRNLSLKSIRETPIPLPPTKAEQTAIATALSDTDALIENLEKLVAKKRDIKQGAMQVLLNPQKKWKLKTYGEVFTFLSTATYSRAELSTGDEIGYVHYGDIHTKLNYFLNADAIQLPTLTTEKAKNYSHVQDGDIIMADASEDYVGIGKSVEVKNVKNRKLISGLHTFLLRDERKILIDGFRGYLHTSCFIKKQFDTLATGMKVYGVTKNNLKTVEIPIPSIEEQYNIAATLINMENEILSLEQKLHKNKLLKKGIMQALLTGKIRLS